MTIKQFYQLLKTIGIPVCYGSFEGEEKSFSPPYMTYQCDTYDFIKADDTIYAKIPHIILTLYQKKRNEKLEEKLENLLFENNLIYEIAEDFNYSEKLYETDYEFYI